MFSCKSPFRSTSESVYLEIAEVVGISLLDVVYEAPEWDPGPLERIPLRELVVKLQWLENSRRLVLSRIKRA
jgi:hypothetical protein